MATQCRTIVAYSEKQLDTLVSSACVCGWEPMGRPRLHGAEHRQVIIREVEEETDGRTENITRNL